MSDNRELSEQIRRNVVDQLRWDSRVDEADVSVDVDGRDVTLRGQVPNFYGRRAAYEDARSIQSVRSVSNDLKVRNPGVEQPADEEIEKTVRRMLAWDQDVDERSIEVTVRSGLVTLSGSVDTLWKRMYAEEVASRAKGLFEIENELTVVPTEDVGDEAVAARIVGAMRRSRSLNENEINVEVKEGLVTLSGLVDTWAQHDEAYRTVLRTAGVRAVDDRLILR